jgi:hypothetical protein
MIYLIKYLVYQNTREKTEAPEKKKKKRKKLVEKSRKEKKYRGISEMFFLISELVRR